MARQPRFLDYGESDFQECMRNAGIHKPNNKVSVAAALIRFQEDGTPEILLLKRPKEKKGFYPGMFCMPSGRMLGSDINVEASLLRMVPEQVGLKITSKQVCDRLLGFTYSRPVPATDENGKNGKPKGKNYGVTNMVTYQQSYVVDLGSKPIPIVRRNTPAPTSKDQTVRSIHGWTIKWVTEDDIHAAEVPMSDEMEMLVFDALRKAADKAKSGIWVKEKVSTEDESTEDEGTVDKSTENETTEEASTEKESIEEDTGADEESDYDDIEESSPDSAKSGGPSSSPPAQSPRGLFSKLIDTDDEAPLYAQSHRGSSTSQDNILALRDSTSAHNNNAKRKMSSHVVVIATDLRRTTVKVAPGTYMTDVLQEACKKLNLSSDKYLVKHRQKPVDLSVPFRTSGLVPGAKLELVQKSNTPSAIQVALQVPQPDAREIPGGRLIRKFPSDLTLWKVLRQFESGEASNHKNINITARAIAQTTSGENTGRGQLYYETPVLNIMGRELASFVDFQKTLSQLGYNSGSVLIRLAYRATEQSFSDAIAEINQFFKEEQEGNISVEPPENSTAVQPDAPKEETEKLVLQAIDTPMAEAEAESLEQQPPQQEEEPNTTATAQEDAMDTEDAEPKDRYDPVHIFLAPSGTTPSAALAPPDDTDYHPTIAHAQLHQARLQKYSRNKRLPSDKELEDKAAAEEAKMAAVKSVLVKVRFPDNTSSDWEVGPAETGRFLYEAVRRVMASGSQPFHLVLPGSTTVIRDDASPKNSLIKAYKISGRTLVNLVWDEAVPPEVRKQAFLKADVAEKGEHVKVPEVAEAEEKSDEFVPQYKTETGEGSGDKGGKRIPKWLKLGKK
ncbi:hypothetical protein G7046_g9320 [Stylonectria norvegica]|nr:hypothetical protein G7046_g9320 [Stylonectria norvegica]